MLRTDQHPDGLPHLEGTLAARVHSANQLYAIICNLVEFCLELQTQANVPRRIVGSLSDHIHIYVDASFEDKGYSRLGGALYDRSGRALAFCSEELDKEFLDLVKEKDQSNVIQEMEMLRVWHGHRVVAFTDSEAVRCSFLKTWSHNNPCSKLLAWLFFVEENNLCPVWLERVPSIVLLTSCQGAEWPVGWVSKTWQLITKILESRRPKSGVSARRAWIHDLTPFKKRDLRRRCRRDV